MEKNESKKSNGRVMSGTVVSDKMKDTVVVEVKRYVKVRKYGKYVTKSKRFKVHDPGNTKKEGDKVEIQETKPISRHKRFKIAITQ